MLLNNLQIQLATAYPDVALIKTQKNRTLFGDIITDQGTVKAYIKLLNIGDIAKEALCAVLARKLHLPVPQAYYVNIDQSIADQPIGNSYSIAFALEQELIPARRIHEIEPLQNTIKNWPELFKCAVFDAWIANRDRLPHNLLYAGNGLFWMIDHDEALPSYLSASSPINPQLLELISKDKSEHELYRIREELMRFAEAYLTIDWDEIKEFVRESILPESQKYFGSHISFLQERALHMRNILSQDLGIKQTDIEFVSTNNHVDIAKK